MGRANGARCSSWTARSAAAVYIVEGPVSGTMSLADANLRVRGDNSTWERTPVAAAGDVNGDGFADLILGNAGARVAGGSGAAFLILGSAALNGGD